MQTAHVHLETMENPQNRINNLIKLGVDKDTARITAYTGNRIAYVCQRRVMNFAINKERLTRFGLVSMLDYYTERCCSTTIISEGTFRVSVRYEITFCRTAPPA